MSVASMPRSAIAGDAARGAQDGAQDILGGIDLRPGGGQLPGGFVQVNAAVACF